MGENSSSLLLSAATGAVGIAGADGPFFELCLLQKLPDCAVAFPVLGVVGDAGGGFGASSTCCDATGCASTAVDILLKSMAIPVNPNTFSSSVVMLPSLAFDEVVGARPESLFLSS